MARGFAGVLLGLVLLCVAPAWAAVGHVERVKGNVTAMLPGGASKPVAAGAPLDERAIVKTGPGGEAVVKFADGALLVLRPDTQVEVSAYRFRDNDPSSRSLIKLVRGGLRFVTGLIGKGHRDNVRFDMPGATVGIRGTDFDTVYRATRAQGLDAGTYTCVNEGATYMTDEKGRRVDIDEGETAFVTTADLIAKGLATATQFGLIEAPAGLFRAGTFDGQLEELKREGIRRLDEKIGGKVPGQFKEFVPSAGALGSFFGGGGSSKSSGGQKCAG